MHLSLIICELILSTLGWLVILELFIFYQSHRFNLIHENIFKPYKEPIKTFDIGQRSQHWDDDRIARLLHDKVRVHCVVYLDRSDYELGPLKVQHAQNTWARRCNFLSIFKLWEITLLEAYRRIFEEYGQELDWLLVVYLDSYVVLENLRYMLAHYQPTEAVYFSAHHAFYIYAHVGQVPSTDYIFSREALAQLATRNCLKDDTFLKECLSRMKGGPSERLLPFNVADEVVPFTLRQNFWIWPCVHQFVYKNQSWESCFGRGVLYPYVSGIEMHLVEFFLYHLRSFGHVSSLPELRSENFPMSIVARPTNDRVARHMFQSVRILCLVLTWPKNYMRGMKAISETWGRHCNRLIFYGVSLKSNLAGVHTVDLNITDSYPHLWGKTKAAFRHAFEHYGDEIDWFYKADDDTYAIMENMRYLLQSHSPDTPIYFGSPFSPSTSVYMSGGAGYVLSREAVNIFVKRGIKKKRCRRSGLGTEDFEMGYCLGKLKVVAGESRDIYGRHRFFSLSLRHFLIPNFNDQSFWLQRYLHHEFSLGMECCSTYTISMHYISPQEMHFLETILYRARPYGIITGHPPLRTSRLATIIAT
ncbi:hypothetical protein KR009_006884 [Drosophila setifemur]|nr:hypothetical protein KR009_006884 [Drosophila setifemur]